MAKLTLYGLTVELDAQAAPFHNQTLVWKHFRERIEREAKRLYGKLPQTMSVGQAAYAMDKSSQMLHRLALGLAKILARPDEKNITMRTLDYEHWLHDGCKVFVFSTIGRKRERVRKATAPAPRKRIGDEAVTEADERMTPTKKVRLKKVRPNKVTPKKIRPKKIRPKKVRPKKIRPKKIRAKSAGPKKIAPKNVKKKAAKKSK